MHTIVIPGTVLPALAKTAPKADSRARLMDILRGLLASWVVLHHVILVGGFNPDIYPWRVFVRHGQEPVLVFFVLSGFAITKALQLRPQRWLSFLIARLWRIYPAYLVALAIGIAAVMYAKQSPVLLPTLASLQITPWSAEEGVPYSSHILSHLVQAHGLIPSGWLPHVDTSLVAPGWSLSTEFQFYILAPLLVALLLRPWVAGNVVPGLALLTAGLWPYFANDPLIAPANILRYVDLFILGMLGAVMHAGKPAGKLAYSLLGIVVALAGWHAGQIIVVTAVVVWLGFWWGSTLPSVDRLIERRFAQFWLFAGAISYPLYILHYPVVRVMLICGVALLPAERAVFLAAWIPATVVASYLLAALVHHYVEVPGTRYGKRLAERRERRLKRQWAG